MKKILTSTIIFTIFSWSCNTTKNIPDDKYLLNEVNIKSDNKNIDVTYFEDYLRQQPNTTIPGLGKVRLGIYNIAGSDTSKWINRFIQNLGQAPVIYSAQLTNMSATQIARELSNQGYLNAKVDTTLKFDHKKVAVDYHIQSGQPYRIREYEYTIDNQTIRNSLRPARKYSRIKPGEMFNKALLDVSRDNLTKYLRNIGYYNFSKEYLYYKADTTLNSHQVDLFLSLYESKDSSSFKKFKIRDVAILSGFDPMSRGNEKLFRNPDTVDYKGVKIIYGENHFLRKSTLYRNNYLRPGQYYADMNYTRTTGAFNGIGVVKQTEIKITPSYNPNDSIGYLDALITLVPGNTHFFQTELQGTNSAGDFGIAPRLTYQHQNLFNGAEILKMSLKGAYEFIPKSKQKGLEKQSYYEFGGDASLSFPLFLFPWLKRSWREQPSASTQVSVGLTNQKRQEYTRQFFNATLTYRWASMQNNMNHRIDLWDINYIRMPWVSESFRTQYLENNSNPILKESYKDQLISRMSYGITITNQNQWGLTVKNQNVIRFNIENSGLLPRLATSFGRVKKNASGQKEILGIAYAEYLKGDISFAQTRMLSKRNSLAYRIGLGVASPYGNSSVLPFESRYFAGGANSLRGWGTRELGPGSYHANDSINDFVNQVGDIKLDLGIEYRHQMTQYIQLAGFIDAGNIWTIRDYAKSQPGGQFKFSTFYKEIALDYGLGIRFDMEFLVLRLDYGIRAYDPGEPVGRRWVIFKPQLRRTALHFAIGYPF